MKKQLAVMPVLAGVLLLPGCIENHQQVQHSALVKEAIPAVTCPAFSEVKARHVMGMSIDRSGSVHDKDQMRIAHIRDDAVQVVRQLPPATLVFVRFIAERSYDDKELYLTAALPEAPSPNECRVTNPFDLPQKRRCQQEQRRYEAQQQCLDTARQRIITALQNLAPARAQATDIFGAIAVAEETFRAYPTTERVLLVYSDLDDNVKLPLPSALPGLRDVKVIVRTARVDTPANGAKRMAAFEQRLAHSGAIVSSLGFEVPLIWRMQFQG